MFGIFGKNKKRNADVNPDLADQCRQYLEIGPPASMTNYVADSVTEIIISHGAQRMALDSQLRAAGSIILLEIESEGDVEYENEETKTYMDRGADLMAQVLGI